MGPTCGRGFLAGSVYYVPLETGAIAGVDLKTGRLLAKSPVRGDFELGNLVAVKGRIISQSVHEIVALNSLDSIQQELKQNLVAGNRPETLVDRGELRLQLGEEAAGLADLRNALETIPTELRQPLGCFGTRGGADCSASCCDACSCIAEAVPDGGTAIAV